jgi:hypothetical protein
MRIKLAMIGTAMAIAGWSIATAAPAQTSRVQIAQADAPSVRLAQAETPSEAAPRRRRPRVRIYREPDERGVYPSYNPGPDAVRDCTATYVQEYRPSGTVITPRMNCFWRRG